MKQDKFSISNLLATIRRMSSQRGYCWAGDKYLSTHFAVPAKEVRAALDWLAHWGMARTGRDPEGKRLLYPVALSGASRSMIAEADAEPVQERKPERVPVSSAKKRDLVMELHRLESHAADLQKEINERKEALRRMMRIGERVTISLNGDLLVYSYLERARYEFPDSAKIARLVGPETMAEISKVQVTQAREVMGDAWVEKYGERKVLEMLAWTNKGY